jgi:hypothetical protein
VSAPRITYVPRPDANPASELYALGVVYRFILDCRAMKEGRPGTAPDAAKKEFKHVRDETKSSP